MPSFVVKPKRANKNIHIIKKTFNRLCNYPPLFTIATSAGFRPNTQKVEFATQKLGNRDNHDSDNQKT